MPLNPRIERWDGQVVWIVGASSGIGRATAARLHAAGAVVVVSARSADRLDDFVADHAGSSAFAFDATDRVAVRDAAAAIVERHGRIDLAVYCAGHYREMRAADFDLDDALKHQQVNVAGALHLIDAVLPVLLRQRSGHLSLISGVAGWRGLPKAMAYGPTKAALINLAECLYFDLAAVGVGVSVVCPGYVETPLTADNDYRMPGLIGADDAARRIVDGWEAGRFQIHFPKRFTWIVKTLAQLPAGLWFRIVRRITKL